MQFSTIFAIFLNFAPFISGTVDTVDITGTAKCGLTTRFMKSQLRPFLVNFPRIPAGLNITYHPLATGYKMENGTKQVTCRSGWLECELEKFQCCSKKHIKSTNATILFETLACLQGLGALKKATDCLPKKFGKAIQKCAESLQGTELVIAEPFPAKEAIRLPYIKINGVHMTDASKNFEKSICQLNSAKNEKRCKVLATTAKKSSG